MTKIEIRLLNIPKAQPDAFIDKIFAEQLPIFQGVYEVLLESEKPIRLKDDSQYIVRPIQVLMYRSYKIQFIAKAETYLELIKYSRNIMISFEDVPEYDHRAKVTEVSRELIRPNVYKVEVLYYDLNSEMVAEYHKSEFLKQSTVPADYYKFYYSDTDFILTSITPVNITDDPEAVIYTNDDTNILVKSVQKRKLKYTFYLSQAELIEIQENIYHYLCKEGANQAQEICAVNITELAGKDIFKTEIEMIYNIDKFYA